MLFATKQALEKDENLKSKFIDSVKVLALSYSFWCSCPVLCQFWYKEADKFVD